MAARQRIAHQAKDDRLTIILRPAARHGLFEARLDGQQKVLAVSRQPFLEAARALLKVGLANPGVVLVARWEGSDTDCLSARLLDAARYAVVERNNGRVLIEPWQPHQFTEGFQGKKNPPAVEG